MRKSAAIGVLLAMAMSAGAEPGQASIALPVTDGTDLRFNHLALGTDPSHRRITGFAQDDFGFLWMGTDDGLMRYDGYRIRAFRQDPGNPNSLGDTYVIALFKDRSGKLWVPTAARLLDVYNPVMETFTPFRTNGRSGDRLSARVGEVNQDRAGTIWLATDDGLYQVDEATWKTVHYRSKPSDANTLSSNVVRATLETKDGTFWVATTAGLDVLDRRTERVERRIAFPMEHSVWTKLVEDHAGVLWMSYSRIGYPGLAEVERTTNTLRHYQLIPPSEKITPGLASMIEDPDGNLWLGGTSAGLFKMDRERRHIVRFRNQASDPKSIAANQVQRLFADREGNIWAGTAGDGTDWFARKPLPFRRYLHEPGNPRSLDKELVWAVYEDSRGILWVGCVRSLVKVDRQSGRFEFYRSNAPSWPGQLSGIWVRTMAEDRAGDMWFGTSSGLNRVDLRTGRVQVYRHDKNNPHSLSNDSVRSLLLDHAGVLWVGTEDGLNAFDANTGTFRVYVPPAAPSQYWKIVEDSHGQLWLSSRWCGVHRFDPATGKFTVYRHSQAAGSLSSDVTTAILADRGGTVWVGTQAGLERLDPSTGAATLFRPTQSAEPILSILEDSGGDLWLGSLNGLLRFDPRRKTFQRYYTSDGLAANELAWGAAWKSSRGEMFFGSQGGLTMFFPEQIREDPYVPPVVLTDIQILGKPVAIGGGSPLTRSISTTDSLVLKYVQNSVSFEFSALSYANAERNRYRYRLEPRDTEWQEVDSSRRAVTYMSIPAGKYVFRVQGSNGRGVWNEGGVRLAMSVQPPWWATWQFRLAALVSVLAAMAGIWRWRRENAKRRFQLQLEAQIDERMRIARELHDTMLQTFQAALIQMQAGYNLLSRRPEKAGAAIEKAITTSAGAIAEGREAIQNMRSSTVTENDLARALRVAGDQMAAEGSVRCEVRVQGAARDLHPVLRDDVYRIALEAMRNAFKHAEAKAIEAEIVYGDSLRVHIRDDGKGIHPAILDEGRRSGHYGLPGMRERAERIGAKLEIWSGVGAGTQIQLTIPGNLAFGKSGGGSLLGQFRRKSKSEASAQN